MARIKVDEVLQSLEHDLRVALARAVQATISAANFDEHELYRRFCSEAYRQCRIWETVPDRYVER